MRKNWMTGVGCAIVGLMLTVTAPAQAGPEYGGELTGNSFGFAWGWGGSGLVDLVAVRAVSGGPFQAGTYTTSASFGTTSMASGWTTIFESPNLRVTSGPGLDSNNPSTYPVANTWWDDPDRTVVWDIVWFQQGQETSLGGGWRFTHTGGVNGSTFDSNGNAWAVTRSDLLAIPLPSSVGLAALGLCGVIGIGVVRRRLII